MRLRESWDMLSDLAARCHKPEVAKRVQRHQHTGFKLSPNNNGFHVEAVFGDEAVDFSVNKVIDFRDKSFEQKTQQLAEEHLDDAMRSAINPSIQRYRNSVYDKQKYHPCACCKKSLDRSKSEVDHKGASFRDIKKTFLLLTSRATPTNFVDDKVLRCKVFVDNACLFVREWIAYHNERASLQILCGSCNRSKGCR